MTFNDARPEPGKWASFALTTFVHLALIVFLIYGIRWQSQPAGPVEVELYRAVPAPAVAPPPPEVKVEPRPQPKPEPKVEERPLPPPPKPDIAIKDKEKPKEEKPKPKEEKPPPKEEKPKPKEEPPKAKEEPRAKPEPDRMRELLARESAQINRNREAQRAAAELNQLAQRQAASAAAAKSTKVWEDRIRAKIRGNIVLPPGVSGNPEAIFDVSLLPDASVLTLRLHKSTGNPALDAAIERAINRSSPLPQPDDPAVFQRELRLRFRPLEG
jgi:colicin import membrane protein